MKGLFLNYLQRASNRLVRYFFITFIVLFYSCRTVSYTIPKSYSMDLDKVKILSSSLLGLYDSKSQAPTDENTLILESNSKNKTTTEILIAYRREGMNILEDIQTGKVIEHQIIIKNNKGDILGTQPIDLTNIKAIEFLSQSLEFDTRKAPAIGDYIAIHIELTYINPYVDIACEDSNLSCKNLNSLLSYPNQESSKLLSKEQTEASRNTIQGKIQAVNKDLSPLLTKPSGTTVTLSPPMNLGDINVIQYREWKLVSAPTYFKVLNILKNGKPVDDGKAEIFELPELPNSVEAEQEKVKTFEIEKEKTPLKSTPSKRRKKTIYLP